MKILFKAKLLWQIVASCFIATLATAAIVRAATTIGTNISTGGNLLVTSTTATSTFSTGGLTVGTNQFVVQQTSGNVGIGTTSPDSFLQISKLYNGGATFLHINNQSDWGQTGDIIFSYHPTVITLGKITTEYRATNSGRISFFPATSGVFNSVALMGIEGGSTYGVGIGAPANPGGLLEITASNTYGTARDLFLLSSDNTKDGDRLIVKNDGSVGIGDMSPNSLLEIASTTADTAITITSGAGSWIMGMDYSDGGKFKIASSSALGANDRFTIDTNGNLGIGTSTPASLLHVSAGASATTTVEFGAQSVTSKTCFNVRDALGAAASFYFVGTTMIVEANRCR